MYLSFDKRDRVLAESLVQLIAKPKFSALDPKELALLLAAQMSANIHPVGASEDVTAVSKAFEVSPSSMMKKLKKTLDRTEFRLVELDESASALIVDVLPRSKFSQRVLILPRTLRGQVSGAGHEVAELSPALITTLRSGLEQVATRKIAQQLSDDLADLTNIDELSELPFLTLVAISKFIWDAHQNEELSRDRCVEILSRLLGMQAAGIVRAVAVFSIPGIGPAISAALFANRLERHGQS